MKYATYATCIVPYTVRTCRLFKLALRVSCIPGKKGLENREINSRTVLFPPAMPWPQNYHLVSFPHALQVCTYTVAFKKKRGRKKFWCTPCGFADIYIKQKERKKNLLPARVSWLNPSSSISFPSWSATFHEKQKKVYFLVAKVGDWG